jgi:hypothetical protein
MPAYEIHFGEGFDGDAVTLSVDGQPIKTMVLTTKMQLGLAHIERVDLKARQMVTVSLDSSGSNAELRLQKSKIILKVSKQENAVVIESTDVSPGYV